MLRAIFLSVLSSAILFSCGKSDDAEPSCDTFTKADSVCFCGKNPSDGNCIPEQEGEITLSLYSEARAALTPHVNNSTLWTKGFAIGRSIYIIDRESTPNAFWKFDLDGTEGWKSLATFPGTDYGLTGAANGKGYVSSYASKKFWEYDPLENKWTAMPDLPFTVAEIHWVEHNGKYYVPSASGIFEFDPSTKEWSKVSTEGASVGAIYKVGGDIFFYDINDNFYRQYNISSKVMREQTFSSDDFGSSTSYNAPFVLNDQAYVISSNDLWEFDITTLQWSLKENALPMGCYGDDVFVIDGKAYLVGDGYLYVFEIE